MFCLRNQSREDQGSGVLGVYSPQCVRTSWNRASASSWLYYETRRKLTFMFFFSFLMMKDIILLCIGCFSDRCFQENRLDDVFIQCILKLGFFCSILSKCSNARKEMSRSPIQLHRTFLQRFFLITDVFISLLDFPLEKKKAVEAILNSTFSPSFWLTGAGPVFTSQRGTTISSPVLRERR